MRLFQRQAGLNQNLVYNKEQVVGAYSWITELVKLYSYVLLRSQAFIIVFLEMCLSISLKLYKIKKCVNIYI